MVLGLSLVAAVAAATVQVVEGPPGSGYGWGSVVVSVVIVVIPLVAIGLMASSGERRFGWATIALALVMSALVLLALVGNWQGQSGRDHVLDAVVAALVLTASAAAVARSAALLRR